MTPKTDADRRSDSFTSDDDDEMEQFFPEVYQEQGRLTFQNIKSSIAISKTYMLVEKLENVY